MKVDGSLGSLVQGVSQQAPTERRQGQHGAQVNMLADPVRGLSRRHGSIWQAERDIDTGVTANVADTDSFRSFDYTAGGKDYTILYRSGAKVAGADLDPLVVYDKAAGAFLPMVRNHVDAALDQLASGGVSAITAVGKYVFMAGHDITPTGTNTDLWGNTTNQQRTVLWVRGGAYSRLYKATVTKADGTQVSFEYKTPASSYPETLDTTGVPVWVPDTSGSTAATGPSIQTNVLGAVASFYPIGATVTLTGTNPSNINMGFGSGANGVGLSNGLDYSLTGNTITFLRDTGNGADSIYIVYQYEVAGTGPTIVYTTVTDTEALYVKPDGAYGKADLTYKDWSPTAMTVRNVQQVLTNVYPVLPANANEYAWAGGNAPVVFTSSLVGNLKITAEYTHTKVLANPNYAKQVNDATNKYNSAVTAWIGTSSAAIQPNAIAASLAAAASTAGLTGVSVVGSTVVFTGIKDITASDGGDGTLLKGLANTVGSVSDLTDAHYIGKVVKISPTGGESFYMKATAKNPSITSGVSEALWVEGAGIGRTIDLALIYGVVSDGHFYVASSAALLNDILPADHPTWAPCEVGDDDSSPMPYFVGRKISYLGVFQDRLLIGSGAVLRCSKVGNYLTFFRASVLTVAADDPTEFLSQGHEDDVIRFSVLYDKDLILFGKRQYLVSGRVPLTPTSANMPVLSTHDGANDAQPASAGTLIFYAKQGQDSVSVHQIQPGNGNETPESYSASTQLDDYMPGLPVDMAVISKPNTLLVRTSKARNSLFVYSYLDSANERRQDCWHRWDYSPALGPTMGLTVVRAGVLVFTLRSINGTQYVVCDLQPLDAERSHRPYLDSNRYYPALGGSLHIDTLGVAAAYDDSTPNRLLGVSNATDLPDLVDELGEGDSVVVGRPFDAYWEPTNPLNRDNNGRSINAGRLTVTALLVAYRDSSGFRSTVTAYGQTSTFEFNGRLVDSETNLVGVVPVSQGRINVPIGRESREYSQRIAALTWLPLNLTAVEWVGQLFHRPQRVG